MSKGHMEVKQRNILGFTIIELIITIILVAILSVYAFMMWPANSISVEAQALQIATDIHYAQSLSMSHGLRYRLAQASASTYQILDSSSNAVVFPNNLSTVRGISMNSYVDGWAVGGPNVAPGTSTMTVSGSLPSVEFDGISMIGTTSRANSAWVWSESFD